MLVVAVFALGPDDVDEMVNPSFDLGLQAHETLGLAVLGLTILRLIWNLVDPNRPDIHMSRAMKIAAKATQGVLYLLLLSVPLTAVLGTWLEGDSLSLILNKIIVSPVAPNENLGELLLDIHPLLADILMWLTAAHAGAGLFHHYILKDGVLRTMLPK